MRIIFLLAALTTTAVAQPTPPTPPTVERPTIERPEVERVEHADDTDSSLVRVILYLDSLRSEMRKLRIASLQIEAEADSVRRLTLPAGSSRRQYLASEVESLPRVLRRHPAHPVSPPYDILKAKFLVTSEGTARDIRVLSGPESRNGEAEEALRSWLFVPAIRKRQRVNAWHESEVRLPPMVTIPVPR